MQGYLLELFDTVWCKLRHSLALYMVVVLVPAMFGVSVAHAKDCEDLSNNQKWISKFSELTEHYKDKSYSMALKDAEVLRGICEHSPVLNYTIAQIYRAQGDIEKANHYIQRATDYTKEIMVDDDLLRKMWFERYEIEHPQARKEAIEERENQIQELNSDISKAREEKIQRQFDDIDVANRERRNYAAGLWTGVGTAGVGLILMGVGAGLLSANRDNSVDFDVTGENGIKPYTKDTYGVYWGMLGAGIAATIVGAAFTAIFGYHYARTVADDNQVSFYGTPNGIGIRF